MNLKKRGHSKNFKIEALAIGSLLLVCLYSQPSLASDGVGVKLNLSVNQLYSYLSSNTYNSYLEGEFSGLEGEVHGERSLFEKSLLWAGEYAGGFVGALVGFLGGATTADAVGYMLYEQGIRVETGTVVGILCEVSLSAFGVYIVGKGNFLGLGVEKDKSYKSALIGSISGLLLATGYGLGTSMTSPPDYSGGDWTLLYTGIWGIILCPLGAVIGYNL